MSLNDLTSDDWATLQRTAGDCEFVSNRFRGIVALGGVLAKIGSVANAARETSVRLEALRAEEVAIKARLEEASTQVTTLTATKEQLDRDIADGRQKLDGLRADRDGLAPEVAEHRRLTAELPTLRQQRDEIEAHITAGRLKFAS